MKMDNTIPTPVAGRVKAIYFKSGDRVNRDDILAVVG
jgi:biotin carboxyl carrier protein